MKIVYFSNIYFTDSVFPLISAFQKQGIPVLYIIKCDSRIGGLFKIKTSLKDDSLYRASSIPEFQVYSDYLNLSNVYIMTKSHGIFNVRNYKNFRRVNKLIKNFNPDIVHITGTPGISEFPVYVFRKKLVLTVHDPFTHSGETNIKNEWKRFLAFRICKKLILLNTNQKIAFEKYYRIKDNKIFINKLGGSFNYLSYLANKPLKLNLPSNYILFFGHFSPYKGIDILCKAMVLIHKSYPDVKCIIAGKGNLNFDFTPYKNLDYIILKNEYIETNVLAKLISKSLFTICPYKDATQSGVVISSFALNKPVLATRVGALPEYVIDNKTGVIAEPNNVESLACNITYLLEHPELLKELSKNIQINNSKYCNSWESIVNKYLYIYNSL